MTVFQLCEDYSFYMERGKNKVYCNDIYASFECLFCSFFLFVLGTTLRVGGFINQICIIKVEDFSLQVRSLKVCSLPQYETDSS